MPIESLVLKLANIRVERIAYQREKYKETEARAQGKLIKRIAAIKRRKHKTN